MRRKDREITDIKTIKKILDGSSVMHIALNNGTYPYILPVNYGYKFDGDKLELFFHSSKEGGKHLIIENDCHAAFEIECGTEFMPPVGEETCTASYAYASVIGQGIIEAVPENEKEEYLAALVAHFGISTAKFSPTHLANTKMYRIKSESYTAKRHENHR